MTEKENSAMRHLILPMLLGAVYLLQMRFSGTVEQFGLWSDHPRGWQFFTHGFLSGNLIHLFAGAGGLWVVCSQFAERIRTSFLLLYFILFSAASSFLYFTFCMSPGSALIGASSGVYSLLGFLSWFQRKKRFEFVGLRWFSMPVLLLMVFVLLVETFMARQWIPALAWPLHWIAFSLSLFVAVAAHGVYALLHRLATVESFIPKRIRTQSTFVLQKIRGFAKGPVRHETIN